MGCFGLFENKRFLRTFALVYSISSIIIYLLIWYYNLSPVRKPLFEVICMSFLLIGAILDNRFLIDCYFFSIGSSILFVSFRYFEFFMTFNDNNTLEKYLKDKKLKYDYPNETIKIYSCIAFALYFIINILCLIIICKYYNALKEENQKKKEEKERQGEGEGTFKRLNDASEQV